MAPSAAFGSLYTDDELYQAYARDGVSPVQKVGHKREADTRVELETVDPSTPAEDCCWKAQQEQWVVPELAVGRVFCMCRTNVVDLVTIPTSYRPQCSSLRVSTQSSSCLNLSNYLRTVALLPQAEAELWTAYFAPPLRWVCSHRDGNSPILPYACPRSPMNARGSAALRYPA